MDRRRASRSGAARPHPGDGGGQHPNLRLLCRRPPPPPSRSPSPRNPVLVVVTLVFVFLLLIVVEIAADPAAFMLAPRSEGVADLRFGFGGGFSSDRRRIFAITPSSSPRKGSHHRLFVGSSSSEEEDIGEESSSSGRGGNDNKNNKKTSVAIVGSGAVGSYYGSRLWEATTTHGDGDGDDNGGEERMYDVRFLARGDHYDACIRDGLHVSSIDGDVTISPDDINVYDSPQKMGPVDWIVVALKSTSLADAPSLIGPLLREDGTTRVVAVMNGLIDEDLVDMIRGLGTESKTEVEEEAREKKSRRAPAPELVNAASGGSSSLSSVEVEEAPPRRRRSGAEVGGMIEDDPRRGRPPPLPCAAVYGGMALLCSNRVAPGRISHTYAGLLTCGVAATSRSIKNPSQLLLPEDDPDLEAVRDLFRPTAIDLDIETCLVRGRWLKNCWNLPYNGVSVAMGGITVDMICHDPGLRILADRIMDETITVANADLKSRGVHPSNFVDRDAVKSRMWSFTDVMGPYKTSTMLDLLARKPMEVRYLFGKPLERARELNVDVPHFETVVLQIEAMQRLHGLF